MDEIGNLITVKRYATLMMSRRGYEIPSDEMIFLDENRTILLDEMKAFMTKRQFELKLAEAYSVESLSRTYTKVQNGKTEYFVLIFAETEAGAETVSYKMYPPSTGAADMSATLKGGSIVQKQPSTDQTKKQTVPLFGNQRFYFHDFLFDKTKHTKVPKYREVSEEAIAPLTKRELPPLPRSEFFAKYFDWEKGTVIEIEYPLTRFPIESNRSIETIQRSKLEWRVVA